MEKRLGYAFLQYKPSTRFVQKTLLSELHTLMPWCCDRCEIHESWQTKHRMWEKHWKRKVERGQKLIKKLDKDVKKAAEEEKKKYLREHKLKCPVEGCEWSSYIGRWSLKHQGGQRGVKMIKTFLRKTLEEHGCPKVDDKDLMATCALEAHYEKEHFDEPDDDTDCWFCTCAETARENCNNIFFNKKITKLHIKEHENRVDAEDEGCWVKKYTYRDLMEKLK